MKFWKPKRIFRFEDQNKQVSEEKKSKYTAGQIFKAWFPFLILTAMVTIWSFDAVKKLLQVGTFIFKVLGLDQLVLKTQPIVKELTPYAAEFKLDFISATGTAIFLAALISSFVLRVSIKNVLITLKETVYELRWPILMIGLVLSFAFISNYSGQSSTLGLLLAKTGALFPFFSPFIGWLGVFLTGSDTSSNALFSNLQQVTAKQIGVNESLLVAAN